MNPFHWIRMRKKSLPELPVEPPIWLGNKSNGEYFHEQTEYDRRLRTAILKKAEENARRIGWGRREFLASSMGMATSLWVINQLAGCGDSSDNNQGSGAFNVPPDAMMDGEMNACMPLDPSKEFIIDLQTHHVNSQGGWRQTSQIYKVFLNALPQSNCGEADSIECFSAKHYIEEMFINSDTAISVLSSIPAEDCIMPVGFNCDTPLRNDEIAATRELVNSQLARSQRLLNHCMVMPNLDLTEQLAEMEAMQAMFGVAAWKCYTPWGPTGQGWFLDDPMIGIPFIEKGRELGVKVFCCHKGLPLPGFDSVHTDPRDIGVVATMFPDVSFIIYHSAFQHGGSGAEGPYDPMDYRGVNSLIKTLEDAGIGKDSNVYAELGSLWGNVMTKPDQAQHVIGKLLVHLGENNIVWGTDCIWTGSPQSQIEAFRAFTITPTFQQMYGYPELTDDIKRKIFGLNAAKIFGVDPEEQRCQISKSELEQAKLLLDDRFGPRRWVFNPPAGPRTRKEFRDLIRWNKGRPG